MSVLPAAASGTVRLAAPATGRVRFHPPRVLCGELEVFEAGETIAEIESESLTAPARGFVLRTCFADGDEVELFDELLMFRMV